MKLYENAAINNLMPNNRLVAISNELKELESKKVDLVGEAMSISPMIGEQFAADIYDIYDSDELCSGFYSEWVSNKLKKEIFKTDMLRLSFNYDKKMFTEKQDDFIKELFFSAIMKARIFGESYADFQFEWAISEYVCGFIFHSDKSVMRMYENLEKKYVLMFDRDRFFIEDSFFDFIGGCDE